MTTDSGTGENRPGLAIYDLVGSGHHRMYLDLVIRWWNDAAKSRILDVWVPPSFLIMHPDWAQGAESAKVRIKILPPQADPAQGEKTASIRQFSSQNRAALEAISKHAPHQIMSMFLDHAQWAARHIRHTGIPVSGILFRSQLGYRNSGIRPKLKQVRKKAVLWASLPHLSRIFCLDPFEVDQINSLAGTDKAVHLPDGVPLLPDVAPRAELRRSAQLSSDDHVAFMGGSLARRKGIPLLNAAIEKLSEEQLKNLVLVFVGAVPDQERSAIGSAITEMSASVRVIFEEGFATDKRLSEWWTICDSVLIPYEGHTGSSHVLLRAARLGKPVVGLDYQLMGAWIKQHKLGVACPSGDAEALGRALWAVQQDSIPGFDAPSAAEFGRQFTVEAMFNVWSNAFEDVL